MAITHEALKALLEDLKLAENQDGDYLYAIESARETVEGWVKETEQSDEYATVIDAIRIHDEGDGWVIDGVDSTTGQYTASLLKYDTFETAAQNVHKIIDALKADGVVFRTVS